MRRALVPRRPVGPRRLRRRPHPRRRCSSISTATSPARPAGRRAAIPSPTRSRSRRRWAASASATPPRSSPTTTPAAAPRRASCGCCGCSGGARRCSTEGSPHGPGRSSTEPETRRPGDVHPDGRGPTDAIVDADGVAAALDGRQQRSCSTPGRASATAARSSPSTPAPATSPVRSNLPWAARDRSGHGALPLARRSPGATRRGRRRRRTPRSIAYCGSGVTSCVDVLAVELAGLRAGPAVRLVVVGVERRSRPPRRDRCGTGRSGSLASPGGDHDPPTTRRPRRRCRR